MPQYLTPKTALPLVVTGKALNRYTNILPNPVNPGRDDLGGSRSQWYSHCSKIYH